MKKLPLFLIGFSLLFSFSTKAQLVVDPAVTNIQVASSSSCLTSNETVLVSVQNIGSGSINLSVNPLVVFLNINTPNGVQLLTDTLNLGLLSGSVTLTVIFTNVNMHGSGCYSINTDSLKLINSNYVTDSNDYLSAAVIKCNSRPAGVDYQLCQGSSIPNGQGLRISNCPRNLIDSVIIPFTLNFGGNTVPNPMLCAPNGASSFAIANMPYLPSSANIIYGELEVTNLTLDSPISLHNASDVRFSLFTTTISNYFHGGLQGSTLGSISSSFNYNTQPTLSDLHSLFTNGVPNSSSLNMGYWSVGTNSCNTASIRVNSVGPTNAFLKIVYEYSADSVKWYEQFSGGVSISDSSVLNPLTTPNNILTNSNTLGTVAFYGACSSDTNCRVACNLTVSGVYAANISATNVSCFGGNDGSIIVNGTGGAPPYVYNLLPLATSNTNGIFSNLGSGTYTIRISDADNCYKDSVVTIFEPSQIQIANVLTTPSSCVPGNDGSITVTAFGGSGSLLFCLPPGICQGFGTFNGLSRGLYIISITDANGCALSSNVFVPQQGNLKIDSITSTAPNCNMGNNGWTSIYGSGGTLPYTYTYGGMNSTSNIFPTFGALNMVRVTDVNGCYADSFHPTPLDINISINSASSSPSICGSSSGTISVTASGGAGNYFYTLSTIPPASNISGNFNNLPSNSYTITATDMNGCSVSTNVFVPQLSSLVLDSVVISEVSCLPGNDGSVTLLGSGGALPYTYHLNAQNSTNNHFSMLSNGIYFAQITDANGCYISTTVSVPSASTNLNWAASNTTSSLCGDSTGTIAISASGGVGAVTYSIVPNIGNVPNTSGNFINLPAGNYIVSAIEPNGCQIQTSVHVYETSNLFLSGLTEYPNGCSGCNASAILHLQGGTPPYSYSLDSNSFQANSQFDSLCFASYQLTAIDINGCSLDTMFSISPPPPVVIDSLITKPVDCIGDSNGAFQVYVSGGISQQYDYSVTPAISPLNWNNLAAGTYVLSVVDFPYTSCFATTNFTISEPPALLVNATPQHPLCSPTQSGVIYITGNGGTPPYDYYHNGAKQGLYPPFLSSGKHEVKVIDTYGCIATDSIELVDPSLIIDSVIITSKKCKYENTGGVLVRYSHSGSGMVAVQLFNTDWIQMNSTNTVDSGWYHVVVVNNTTNCTDSQMIYIPFEPYTFALDNYRVTDVSCPENKDGKIEYLQSHFPAYNYSIKPVIGLQTDIRTFANLPAGQYVIIGENINGCSGLDTVTIGTINDRSFFYARTKNTNVHCYGSVQFEAIGGIGDYAYSIYPDIGQQVSNGFYEGLCWGEYSILATDSKGCSISQTIEILEDPNAPFNMFDYVTVYPNPASNVINFKSNYLFEYQVTLIDALGQCIKTKNIYSTNGSLVVDGLAPGLYILRFKSIIDNADKKVLIQR